MVARTLVNFSTSSDDPCRAYQMLPAIYNSFEKSMNIPDIKHVVLVSSKIPEEMLNVCTAPLSIGRESTVIHTCVTFPTILTMLRVILRWHPDIVVHMIERG